MAREGIAPRPCIRLDPSEGRTMKQSFASAARLRDGGPLLTLGMTTLSPASCSSRSAMVTFGEIPQGIVLRQPA